MNKLNRSQYKCVRQILKVQTTFINRANTNPVAFGAVARKLASSRKANNLTHLDLPISPRFQVGTCKLLGNLLRRDNSDFVWSVGFEPSSARPVDPICSPASRPRTHWTHRALTLVCEKHELANLLKLDTERSLLPSETLTNDSYRCGNWNAIGLPTI